MFWIRVVLCCICLPLPTPPPTLCPRFGGWESSAFFSTVWALKTRHRFVARSNLGWIAVMTVTMCHKQKTMNLSQHYFKPNANHSTLTQRPKPLKQPSGPLVQVLAQAWQGRFCIHNYNYTIVSYMSEFRLFVSHLDHVIYYIELYNVYQHHAYAFCSRVKCRDSKFERSVNYAWN